MRGGDAGHEDGGRRAAWTVWGGRAGHRASWGQNLRVGDYYNEGQAKGNVAAENKKTN